MSWACGGRCACTEAGRSLLEPYGMASPRQPDPSAGLPSDLEKSGPPTARRRPRTASQRRQMLPLQASIPTIQAFLIAIFSRGFVLAQRLCAECHAIQKQYSRSPNANAPHFQAVASIPGMTATALSAALNTSHRAMPNIMLPADEQADIIAYILSLK